MFPNSVETLVARAVAVISTSPGLPPTYDAITISWGTESSLKTNSQNFFISPVLANNTITARTVAVISHVPGLGPTYTPINIPWLKTARSSLQVASYHAFAPVLDATGTLAIRSVGTPVGVDAYIPLAAVSLALRTTGDVYVQGRRSAWVKWSDIGTLDFTIDASNVAGERPLGLNGAIYRLLPLGGQIAAYCQNGVAILSPAGAGFSSTIIYRSGVKSKLTVATGGGIHFFIDDQDKLVRLRGDSLPEVLGFSEYLSTLTTPVLFCDPRSDLLHISGANAGYIYNYSTRSFTGGLAGITGFGFNSGSGYIASTGAVTVPAFEIVTDVFDFGDRRHKTVFELETGSDTDISLEAQIYYRRRPGDSFRQTEWKKFNHYGRAVLVAMGIEFKVAVRSVTSSSFELDYLTVFGRRHKY